jgi:hypothetical protein
MPNAQTPDGVLAGSGWMQQPGNWLLVLAGPETLTSWSRYVLCLMNTPWSLTLPAANSVAVGVNITFKKIDNGSNPVMMYAAGSDLVETASVYSLFNPMDYVTFVSDGISNWSVVKQGGTFVLDVPQGIGLFGHLPPLSQPSLCVTLNDVINVLQSAGLCPD